MPRGEFSARWLALIRDGLWGIVNETEQAPEPDAPVDRHVKFASR